MATDARYPWPHEIELLLACGRGEMRDVDIARASDAVARGLAWPRVLALAREHHMIPLLHLHVSRGHAAAPAQVHVHLQSLQQRIAKRNLLLSRALLDLLEGLRAAGIQALPLKGPVLAQQIYGSVALRQFGDLDLLVPSSRVDEALAELAKAGYVRRLAGESLQHGERRHSHHIGLIGPDHVTVELHRSLISKNYGFRIAFDELQPDLVSVPFMRGQASALSAEALLVYLCQHGADHAWSRIEWMATARECARRVTEWDDVWAVAKRFGAEGQVSAALELFEVLFEPGLGDRAVGRGNAMVLGGLAGRPLTATSLGYAFATTSGARRRARRLYGLLGKPHTADALALPLSPRWSFLHHFVRPIRLLFRAAAGATERDDA